MSCEKVKLTFTKEIHLVMHPMHRSPSCLEGSMRPLSFAIRPLWNADLKTQRTVLRGQKSRTPTGNPTQPHTPDSSVLKVQLKTESGSRPEFFYRPQHTHSLLDRLHHVKLGPLLLLLLLPMVKFGTVDSLKCKPPKPIILAVGLSGRAAGQ